MLNDKSIIITGGTGSFGKKCVEEIISRYTPARLIIFSRDELKQFEMAQVFSQAKHPFMRYFIGDVRDKERLRRAFDGVDYVIHAAALKQVPAMEYNPFEAVKTNILGAQNIIDASIDMGVKKVIALSTDKAAAPINLYGATKLCSDKLFVSGNSYASKDRRTVFSVIRYGNVVGSRGSVIPLFLEKRAGGVLPVTDKRMTRFWIRLEQGVDFVLRSLDMMVGGEMFIPKIPSIRIVDLAKAICPECRIEIIGVRPGEKLHEVLIPNDEARRTLEFKDYYILRPDFKFFSSSYNNPEGKQALESFEYNSLNNPDYLGVDEIKHQLAAIYPEQF